MSILVSVNLPSSIIARPPLLLKSTPNLTSIEFLDGTTQTGEIVRIISPDDLFIKIPPREKTLIIKINNAETLIPLPSIFSISPIPAETILFKSNNEVECFSLGKNAKDIPEPPNWFLHYGSQDFWQKAVTAHQSANWYYIPGAMWIWSNKNWGQINGETVLFRHSFEIPEDFVVARAILYITADSYLESLYLNGVKTFTPKDCLIGKVAKYDVSQAIENGENLLAFRVSNPQEKEMNFACLAFSLEVDGFYKNRSPFNPQKSQPYPPVILFLEYNDIMKGNLININPQITTIQTEYGKFDISTDWIREILFSSDENIESAMGDEEEPSAQNDKNKQSEAEQKRGLKNLFGKLGISGSAEKSENYSPIKKSRQDACAPIIWKMPRKKMDKKEGVLFKDGKFIEGKTIQIKDYIIKLKPRLDPEEDIPLIGIKSIYPNPPAGKGSPVYDLSEKLIPAIFVLINGDTLCGIIENLTRSDITISTPYSEKMKISLSNILKIYFPYNSILRTKLNLQTDKIIIGILGETKRTTKDYEETTFYKTDRILKMLGVEGKWINPTEIPQKDFLTHENFKIILNLDECEQYYHTIYSKGDGFNAIINYVNNGGNLAHLATGIPFYYGYVAQVNRWTRMTFGGQLNSALKLRVVPPGETSDGIKTFELPENNGAELFFVLNKDDPFSKFLPEKVLFPAIKDTRFRPVAPINLSQDEEFHSIYILKDELDKTYGTAFGVVAFKDKNSNTIKNFTAYCSHTLFYSYYQNISMLNFIIPKIIEFSLINR